MNQTAKRIPSQEFIKSLPVLISLAAFFSLFVFFIFPKYRFLSEGFPSYLNFSGNFQRAAFAIHIIAGIIVYVSAILQFVPAIRNNFPGFHRKVGRVYIVASFLCVAGLYVIATIIPVLGLTISQIVNGTIWVCFVILAFRFIRTGNVTAHKRCMISSFICASYFVTVRLVDRLFMPFFRSMTESEESALIVSDFSVFVLPLAIVWIWWTLMDRKSKRRIMTETESPALQMAERFTKDNF